MDTLLRYYKGSFLLFFAGIVAAYFLGGMQAVFIILILCILEISLSFDNAVVNATVLEDMTEVWRRRFLTWGILIAVFGMRIIFPVVIVNVNLTLDHSATDNGARCSRNKKHKYRCCHRDYPGRWKSR